MLESVIWLLFALINLHSEFHWIEILFLCKIKLIVRSGLFQVWWHQDGYGWHGLSVHILVGYGIIILYMWGFVVFFFRVEQKILYFHQINSLKSYNERFSHNCSRTVIFDTLTFNKEMRCAYLIDQVALVFL